MDRLEVEELEENVKVYDSDYKPKKVMPGSVIDIIEENGDIVKSQIIYVRNKDQSDAPYGLNNISYELASKYLLGCYKDETVDVEGTKVTIAEIYKNVDEYINRNVDRNTIRVGSVVDTIHNGVNRIYHIIEANNEAAFQKGVDDLFKATPLGVNLLNKKKGDVVNFEVALNPNTVIISEVYENINDYNKKNNISIVRPGSVVDITIDGIPFVFNCVSDISEKGQELLDVINMDIPLGRELLGKTTGDSFTYTNNGFKMNGYINKVYDSQKDYLDDVLNSKKQKTL